MAEPIDPDLPTGAVAGRRGGASRFLCDEMLGRLARYLRAAGYDTVLAAGGLPDSVWIGLAHREARLLLTCDRALAQGRHARDLIVNLEQGDLDRQAEALRKQCGVDWLWRPFSRCLIDNSQLERADASAVGFAMHGIDTASLRICPGCGRLYWAGSHHRRMHERLRVWQQR
ncbi:Mut7-C RNAse domain-containing protein [Cognatazoarcus halotolerans]|uniref:Mut7-C RNAse domain-containing protein n=1 Tax=Cognatazoarcus halotolerans TaxID=2686016 RepID=UPI00135AA96F|nr:Mut7-C RNAse domain-containing protein [Cognatazoarcus halotolerans]MCB1900838.1 hypothetical protein [Rhodocyclaceae bacterium]MCP5308087.1 hypothetical protein [Zoogloeaceae bacterium]